MYVEEYRMMNMGDREVAVLYDLYTFRALTTEQIREKHFANSRGYVDQVLFRLRKEGFIKTSTVANSRPGRKGYSCHRLTEKGVDCLLTQKIKVDTPIQNLYVKPQQMNYLLMFNELAMKLGNTEWKVMDSRSVKKRYNLDARSNIQGLVIDTAGIEYGVYILNETSKHQTIGKIRSEIMTNRTTLPNYYVLAKGMGSYTSFREYGMKKRIRQVNNRPVEIEPINTTGKVKLAPYTATLNRMMAYENDEDWLYTLSKYHDFKIISTEKQKDRQSFPVVVNYRGRDYYFVDMTDFDFSAFQQIKLYKQHDYDWERKPLLIHTLQPNFIDLEKEIPESELITHLKMNRDDYGEISHIVSM